jgi:tetratricopeptide (TPR) repeat protein
MNKGKPQLALTFFNKAIECDPTESLYYGNRSEAYLKSSDTENALKDSNTLIQMRPEWAKAYKRHGDVLFQMAR